MKVVSLFSGAGGMDLGFRKAGFEIIWANECDKTIYDTYTKNHYAFLDTRDIRDISSCEIPECDGIIGGPPCQSWSVGGLSLGIEDERGKLFYQFLRVIREKKPKFFVIENVPGLLFGKHRLTYLDILSKLASYNYTVTTSILDASDYTVPQNRKRLLFVGIRHDFDKIHYALPNPVLPKLTIRDAFIGLSPNPKEIRPNSRFFPICTPIANHEYLCCDFPKNYKNYDKVRNWCQQAYTVRTNGKYMQLHPQAPHMIKLSTNHWEFDKNHIELYRRFSVRECARLQTFPDSFEFIYYRIEDGYKMVGNAVPVKLAFHIAKSIFKFFEDIKS